MAWALSTSSLSRHALTKSRLSQRFLQSSLPLVRNTTLQKALKNTFSFRKVCCSKMALQCVGGRSRAEVISHGERLAEMQKTNQSAAKKHRWVTQNTFELFCFSSFQCQVQENFPVARQGTPFECQLARQSNGLFSLTTASTVQDSFRNY